MDLEKVCERFDMCMAEAGFPQYHARSRDGELSAWAYPALPSDRHEAAYQAIHTAWVIAGSPPHVALDEFVDRAMGRIP